MQRDTREIHAPSAQFPSQSMAPAPHPASTCVSLCLWSGSSREWLQPHDPRLSWLSGGCKAPRAQIPAAKAGDSHLPQGRDQHESGLLFLPTCPSTESSISSERRMPYCSSADSMDTDAVRIQDCWLAQMSGVITLMAIFLPVAAWAPKYSHVGMSGTVLEEAA